MYRSGTTCGDTSPAPEWSARYSPMTVRQLAAVPVPTPAWPGSIAPQPSVALASSDPPMAAGRPGPPRDRRQQARVDPGPVADLLAPVEPADIQQRAAGGGGRVGRPASGQ